MIKQTKTFNYGEISFKIDPTRKSVLIKAGVNKYTIKKSDLWQMAFMISKDKEQDDLIPVEKRPMMRFTRLFKVKATKDLKKGEIMEFHTEIDVPLMVVDQLLQEKGVELETVIKPKDLVIPTPVDS